MAGYRNKFETKAASILPKNVEYETIKLPYVIDHNYIPDFIDQDNKVIYETKGRFTAIDRRKHMALKQQHPEWTIVLVFQNPNIKISKNSKTNYGQWCDKNGIRWMTLD